MAKNQNIYFSWNLETGCERGVPTDLGPHGAVLERNAVVIVLVIVRVMTGGLGG